MMEIHEQIVVRLAKERIADALREAERWRAAGLAGPRQPARVRLGGALVRLGQWLSGHSSPTPSERATETG